MIEQSFFNRAIEKLGFRQTAYKRAFGVPGSPEYLALIDLADYCGAFRSDESMTQERMFMMAGRRQVFFRLWQHLHLNQTEMETVFKGALIRAAESMKAQGVS